MDGLSARGIHPTESGGNYDLRKKESDGFKMF